MNRTEELHPAAPDLSGEMLLVAAVRERWS